MIRIVTLLLLGGIAAGSVFYFHNRSKYDAVWWQNECDREELAGRLEVLKVRLADKDRECSLSKIEEIRASLESLQVRAHDVRAASAILKDDISKLVSDFDHARSERTKMVRESMIGQEWPEISFKEKTYQDAKVVQIDDSGIALRHRHGSAMIRYSDLTEEQQDQFALDLDSSLVAERRERESAARYSSWVDRDIAERAFISSLVTSETIIERTLPARKHVGVWRQVQTPALAARPSLKITPLSAPARRLSTDRRIYSGSSRPVYYYAYRNGGGAYSPGFNNNGTSTGWKFVNPPVVNLPKLNSPNP